jgi:glucokinase
MYQPIATEFNEFLVRDTIRERGEVTRRELSERLGLSAATISRVVRRLIEAGSVLELASSSPGRGRASDVLRYNHRSGCVVAVDLGGTKCHGVVADLAAQTIAEDVRPTLAAGDPASTLLRTIEVLQAAADQAALPLRAVVVGIPAVPDPDSGLIVYGTNVNWHGYDLMGLLHQHLDAPLRIENDVTLAAIGHAWRGEAQSVNGFVTVSIGTGIGAAAFVNGQIIRGRHNAAGEVGALLTSREQLRAPAGRLCGFESVASGPAIERRASELLASGRESSLSTQPVSAEAVFRAAAQGDALAEEVLDELIDHVSMAIVDIAAVLDPERVILEGSVGRALEPYAAELAHRIGNRIPNAPVLRFSRLGQNATVVGALAAALALDRDQGASDAVLELSTNGLRALTRLPSHGQGVARSSPLASVTERP